MIPRQWNAERANKVTICKKQQMHESDLWNGKIQEQNGQKYNSMSILKVKTDVSAKET